LSKWLRSWIKQKKQGDSISREPVVELLVLEGVDAGEQFTVDGDEVLIGRRLPQASRSRGVLLKDPTVSSKQAVIRRRDVGLVIEHHAGATNPTLVDGRPAVGQPLVVGSRIQVGRVQMEVRASEGMALSHLTQMFSAEARDAASTTRTDHDVETEQLMVPRVSNDVHTTEIRPVVTQLGELILERGLNAAAERSFPVWSTGTTIGRAKDNDVQLADMGVSRRHAELTVEDGRLLLVHHSKVNITLLNGCEVIDREAVNSGDVIQLADKIVLRVRLGDVTVATPGARSAEQRRPSLMVEMEEKVKLDDRIEERFSVEGSFLDVDIVNSYGMKNESTRADYIVVSFERFRAYVGGVVVEFNGHVLNSNGDELMCYFESTFDSVLAGCQILERLENFNAKQNLLPVPFRFRLGIHTGRSLVDLDQGVAYSAVLDVAGHLQKLAEHNSLFISEQTHSALPDGLPFEQVGTMEREGLAYFKLVGPISR
jgi:pSer/pThr/pTyr-binding forkhead associated (FHA) protein